MRAITGLCLITFGILLFAPAAATAAPAMKPGLWSVTSTVDMGGMMPKMSPQQMEMMKRMNVKIPGAGGSPISTQICVTEKDRAEAMAYADTARKENGCQTKNVRTMGNTTSADIVCTGEMKGQGRATTVFKGDRAYNGSFAFKGTSRGRPIDMKSTSSAKFVSADCGKVKPFTKP